MHVRRRVAAAPFAAFALAWLLVARAGAADEAWHEVNRDPPTIVLGIPAGGLPPGPAILRANDDPPGTPPRATVRFAMPREGGIRVRIPVWLEDHPAYYATKVPFVATSESGPAWHGEAAPNEYGQTRSAEILFLGDAAAYSAFSDAARTHALPSQMQHLLSGVRVETYETAMVEGCRRLASDALVIAANVPASQGETLRSCASRGANVLFTEGDTAGPVSAYPAGSAISWGLGAVAWAPGWGEAVVRGAFDFPVITEPQSDPRSHLRWEEPPSLTEATTGSWSPRRAIVLGFLLIYVGILGPVGFLVDRKARRPWLAWAWLPGIAGGATVVLAGTLVATEESRRPSADVYVTAFTSPDGVGLTSTQLRIRGSRPDDYTVTLPWHDADGRFGTTFNYGSPFGSGSPRLELHEDDIAGTMTATGLGVSRRPGASATITQPTRTAVARLEQRDGNWVVFNDTGHALDWVDVSIGSHTATIDGLAAGEAHRLASFRPVSNQFDKDQEPRREHLRNQARELAGPRSAYVIVSQSTGEDSGLTTSPALPQQVETRRVVIGPAPVGATLP